MEFKEIFTVFMMYSSFFAVLEKIIFFMYYTIMKWANYVNTKNLLGAQKNTEDFVQNARRQQGRIYESCIFTLGCKVNYYETEKNHGTIPS